MTGPAEVPGLPVPAADPPLSDRVRTLLARAAQEQVDEQRAVSGALSAVRDRVDALADAVSRTASGAGVERVAGDVAALAEELRAATADLGERLERAEGRLGQLASGVEALVAQQPAAPPVVSDPADLADALSQRLSERLAERLAAAVDAAVRDHVQRALLGLANAVLAHPPESASESASEPRG